MKPRTPGLPQSLPAAPPAATHGTRERPAQTRRPARAGRLARTATLLAACAGGSCGERPAPTLFQRLDPAATGIHFANELPEAPDFNILNYLYYYNGGGVAVGDVDGDDLPDLYFTSNLGPDRLYRNRGDLVFEDVTDESGLGEDVGWTTGVTMADVDGDGHLDLYVSAVSHLGQHGRNRFLRNDGSGHFRDETEAFGLGHEGYSTQAAFFDYDRDGDLDVYLLSHSVHTERGVSARPQREGLHARAGDRLLRNDGGHFVDVTLAAGIYAGVEGYGLGVVVSDLDGNGCPDLYVANDFQENDFFYRNRCDGTFEESAARSLGHTSQFSMGTDAADVDNDGWPDLVTLDMQPADEAILMTSAHAESYDVHELKVRAGYLAQFPRNTLQLNRGGGRFSDVAYLAGVEATDWSWAPLLADLDNDGHKDLFVSNGIVRRPNDLDYINFISNEAIQASLAQGISAENLTLIERMPKVPIPNYAFHNEGGGRFRNLAGEWGLGDPGFSNGAAYADLDNDGDLDLVVNNLQAPAALYRNRARELSGAHFLRVLLQGDGANRFGVGARVRIVHGSTQQVIEQSPTRGFLSSVDPRLHFGLGGATAIDTLRVDWPDGRTQTLTHLTVDTVLTLAQSAAQPASRGSTVQRGAAFTDVADSLGVRFRHRENPFYDYGREPLMPHKLSTEGPPLAVGDLDGDGLEDLFVGGAKHQSGTLWIQSGDGRFRDATPASLRADSLSEDVAAAFLDADGDGALDLFVVSGGNEFTEGADPLLDRLYRNDGHGVLVRDREAVPAYAENGGTVAAGDFNGDGATDLFVGGRVVAGAYGRTPRSALLVNDGSGRFRDVTDELAPGLARAGMVSSADWTDTDEDGRLDLVLAGEWMGVRVWRQTEGGFQDETAASGLEGMSGWWTLVRAVDLTGDGREDLVLGNLGLNSVIRGSVTEPVRLYVHDFDGNGVLEQVLTVYRQGVPYPLVGRDELVRQVPTLRGRFPSYAAFGARRVEDIFTPEEREGETVLEATHFASAVAIALGDGTFAVRELPYEAQFAPLYAALPDDFDGDGRMDLMVAGNFYGVPPLIGQYDASYGLLLSGDGSGGFTPVPLLRSGLLLEGAVRDLRVLRGARGERWIVVARNDASVQILAGPGPARPSA